MSPTDSVKVSGQQAPGTHLFFYTPVLELQLQTTLLSILNMSSKYLTQVLIPV